MPKSVGSTPRSKKETCTFTLILAGVSRLTDKVQDALFESGCDDAILGSCAGIVSLDFSREADSFPKAIQSAIVNVESAGIGATVERIELDEGSISKRNRITVAAFNAILELRRAIPDKEDALPLVAALYDLGGARNGNPT